MSSPRTALVTGAGRGIGRVVALRLSAAGYRVVLTARSREQLEAVAADCAGDTVVVPADVTAPGAVDEIFTVAEREAGPVEALVLNAGAAASAPLHRITDADWQRQLDLNLTAPFQCLRRAVPSMRERGFGRVVAIASVASKHGDPYIAAYTAAKHGLLGLVRSAAAELATKGVTVNAVCPAYVDTPMTDTSVANIAAMTGSDAAAARAVLEDKQPIGRLITPEEVADAVMLCIGSSGITGQGINVDGGAVQS